MSFVGRPAGLMCRSSRRLVFLCPRTWQGGSPSHFVHDCISEVQCWFGICYTDSWGDRRNVGTCRPTILISEACNVRTMCHIAHCTHYLKGLSCDAPTDFAARRLTGQKRDGWKCLGRGGGEEREGESVPHILQGVQLMSYT